MHKSVCLDDEKLTQAYSHVKCMDKDTKQGLAYTVTVITSFANFVSKLEDVDEIIPAICCGNKNVTDQCYKIIDDLCLHRTGPATARYIVNIVYSAFSEVFDMMCSKFPDDNACQKHAPRMYSELKNALANVINYNHTLTIPFIKIIRKLDGQVTTDG